MALSREQIDELFNKSVVPARPVTTATSINAGQNGSPDIDELFRKSAVYKNTPDMSNAEFLAQFPAPPEPQKDWSILGALQGGFSDMYNSKANVKLMDADVAEAKGDFVTAKNLRDEATAYQGKGKKYTPEEYADPTGISGFAEDIVRSLPYSLKSMGINTAASAAGLAMLPTPAAPIGVILPILAALYTGHEEAEGNQAQAFRALMEKGVGAIQAEKETSLKTYGPSMAVTAPLNLLSGGLLGAVRSGASKAGLEVLKKTGAKMVGQEAAERVANSGIARTLGNLASSRGGRMLAGAGDEFVEEGVQTATEQWGARDPLDIGSILYSGLVGGASGGLTSGAIDLVPGGRNGAEVITSKTPIPTGAVTQVTQSQPTVRMAEAPIVAEAKNAPVKNYTADDIAETNTNIAHELSLVDQAISMATKNNDQDKVSELDTRKGYLSEASLLVEKADGFLDTNQGAVNRMMNAANNAFVEANKRASLLQEDSTAGRRDEVLKGKPKPKTLSGPSNATKVNNSQNSRKLGAASNAGPILSALGITQQTPADSSQTEATTVAQTTAKQAQVVPENKAQGVIEEPVRKGQYIEDAEGLKENLPLLTNYKKQLESKKIKDDADRATIKKIDDAIIMFEKGDAEGALRRLNYRTKITKKTDNSGDKINKNYEEDKLDLAGVRAVAFTKEPTPPPSANPAMFVPEKATPYERNKAREANVQFLGAHLGTHLTTLSRVLGNRGGKDAEYKAKIDSAIEDIKTGGTYHLARVRKVMAEMGKNRSLKLGKDGKSALSELVKNMDDATVKKAIGDSSAISKALRGENMAREKEIKEISRQGKQKTIAKEAQKKAEEKREQSQRAAVTLEDNKDTGKRLGVIESQIDGLRRAKDRLNNAKEASMLSEEHESTLASLKTFLTKYDNAKDNEGGKLSAAASFPNNIDLNHIADLGKGFSSVTPRIIEAMTYSDKELADALTNYPATFGPQMRGIKSLHDRMNKVRKLQAEFARHNDGMLTKEMRDAISGVIEQRQARSEEDRAQNKARLRDLDNNMLIDAMVQYNKSSLETLEQAAEYLKELEPILREKAGTEKTAKDKSGKPASDIMPDTEEVNAFDRERASKGLEALGRLDEILLDKDIKDSVKLLEVSRFVQRYGFNNGWITLKQEAPMAPGKNIGKNYVTPVEGKPVMVDKIPGTVLTEQNYEQNKGALRTDVLRLIDAFGGDNSAYSQETIDDAQRSMKVLLKAIEIGDFAAVKDVLSDPDTNYNFGWSLPSTEMKSEKAMFLPLSPEARSAYELSRHNRDVKTLSSTSKSGQKNTNEPGMTNLTLEDLATGLVKFKKDVVREMGLVDSELKNKRFIRNDTAKAKEMQKYRDSLDKIVKISDPSSELTDMQKAKAIQKVFKDSPTHLWRWRIEGVKTDKKLETPKYSTDLTSGNSVEFVATKENIQKLFGKNAKVFSEKDGKFSVKTANGNRVVIGTDGVIEIGRKAVEQSWGKAALKALDSGEAKFVGLFTKNEYGAGVSAISLLEGEATNFTANHEVFHFAVATAMSEKQWRTLKEAYENKGATDAQIEERLCDDYGRFKEGRLETAPKVRRIFNRVADFFDTLRGMVTGKESTRQIFRDVESGKIYNQKGDGAVSGIAKASVEKESRPIETVTEKKRPKTLADHIAGIFKGEDKTGSLKSIADRMMVEAVDDRWYARTYLGREVHKKMEMALAGLSGKVTAILEYGDPENGAPSIKSITKDIAIEDKPAFDNAAVYNRFKDVASDREAYKAEIESRLRLAKMEKENAKRIKTDYLGDSKGQFGTPEIRMYTKAYEGSMVRYKELLNEAKELRKIKSSKVTNKSSAEYKKELDAILAKHPEWKEKLNQVVRIGRSQLKRALKAGLITQEAYDKMVTAHPNYVPVVRDIDTNETLDMFQNRLSEGLLDISSPFKRFHGGDEHFLSPVEQLIYSEGKLQRLIARQETAAAIAEQVDSGKIDKEIVRPLNKKDELKKTETDFYVYKNGNRSRYAMDKDIAHMLEAFGGVKEQDTLASKVAQVPGTILRLGVTRSPGFWIPNMLRDSMLASVVNPEVRPFVDSVKGLWIAINKNKPEYKGIYEDWLRHGGQQSMNWGSKAEAEKEIKSFYKKAKNGTLNSKSATRRFVQWLGDMAELSEEATRIGSYKRMVEMGVDKDEAGYRTVDQLWFSRGGRSSKYINKYVPFSNVAIQGTYSLVKALGRGGKLNKKALARGLMYITVPSIALTMWNLSDDDRRKKYLEIPEWKRNASWCYVLGDDIITIPKPHSAGIIMGSMVERLLEYTYGKDKRAFDNFTESFLGSVAPEVMPLVFKTPYELWSNWSGYYDRPIVPASELQYSPTEQYGPYTSDTARWMAKAIYKGTDPFMNLVGKEGFEFSPRKIEYAINAFTGNLGRDVTKVMDTAVRAAERKELPTSKWYDGTPLVSRFLSDPARMRRTEQTFREEIDGLLEDLNTATLRAKGTPRDKISDRDKKLLGAKSSIQGIQTKELRAVSTLQKEIKEITKDSRMSGERKRQLIETREKKINIISEQAIKKIDRITSKIS